MNDERCRYCGCKQIAHLNGKCPPLGLHVTIDADALERADKTGHPRLLKNLLKREVTSNFRGVDIGEIRVVSRSTPPRWSAPVIPIRKEVIAE